MTEKLTSIPNEALVCISDKKYLDELVEHYSKKDLSVDAFNYGEEFLVLTSNSHLDFKNLREGVPYEKAKYITPAYDISKGQRKYLKAEIGVEFVKDEISDEELSDFLKETNLTLKRKGEFMCSFNVPQGDGETTLKVVKKLKKHNLVKTAYPNYLTKLKKFRCDWKMPKQYIEGKVQVAFKPDTSFSDIEKILENYKYTKVFSNKDFNPNSKNKDDRVLARLYLINTGKRKETEVLDELNNKYSSLVEYIELISARKLINPKPD